MKFGFLAAILGMVGTAEAGLPGPSFGPAMIERLRDVKTRHEAVAELANGAGMSLGDKRDLPKHLRDLRLTRCPSPQGMLWMVSFVWDWEAMHRISVGFEEGPAAYPLLPDDPANPENPANAVIRFPEASGEGEHDGLWSPPAGSLADRILIFLTENGDVVWPFGGANVTHQGRIADLTGDGVLERAESTSWGHPVDRKTQVEITSLRISTIEPAPHRLLTVLYNWHSREADKDSRWDWELRDTDGDGRLEACLGPKLAGGGIDAQAVYRWNPATQSYDGPEGGIGQHFLRQPDPSADDWEWLKQIAAKGGLGYPLHQSPPEIGKKPVVPPLPPFVPGSLAGRFNSKF